MSSAVVREPWKSKDIHTFTYKELFVVNLRDEREILYSLPPPPPKVDVAAEQKAKSVKSPAPAPKTAPQKEAQKESQKESKKEAAKELPKDAKKQATTQPAPAAAKAPPQVPAEPKHDAKRPANPSVTASPAIPLPKSSAQAQQTKQNQPQAQPPGAKRPEQPALMVPQPRSANAHSEAAIATSTSSSNALGPAIPQPKSKKEQRRVSPPRPGKSKAVEHDAASAAADPALAVSTDDVREALKILLRRGLLNLDDVKDFAKGSAPQPKVAPPQPPAPAAALPSQPAASSGLLSLLAGEVLPRNSPPPVNVPPPQNRPTAVSGQWVQHPLLNQPLQQLQFQPPPALQHQQIVQPLLVQQGSSLWAASPGTFTTSPVGLTTATLHNDPWRQVSLAAPEPLPIQQQFQPRPLGGYAQWPGNGQPQQTLQRAPQQLQQVTQPLHVQPGHRGMDSVNGLSTQAAPFVPGQGMPAQPDWF